MKNYTYTLSILLFLIPCFISGGLQAGITGAYTLTNGSHRVDILFDSHISNPEQQRALLEILSKQRYSLFLVEDVARIYFPQYNKLQTKLQEAASQHYVPSEGSPAGLAQRALETGITTMSIECRILPQEVLTQGIITWKDIYAHYNRLKQSLYTFCKTEAPSHYMQIFRDHIARVWEAVEKRDCSILQQLEQCGIDDQRDFIYLWGNSGNDGQFLRDIYELERATNLFHRDEARARKLMESFQQEIDGEDGYTLINKPASAQEQEQLNKLLLQIKNRQEFITDRVNFLTKYVKAAKALEHYHPHIQFLYREIVDLMALRYIIEAEKGKYNVVIYAGSMHGTALIHTLEQLFGYSVARRTAESNTNLNDTLLEMTVYGELYPWNNLQTKALIQKESLSPDQLRQHFEPLLSQIEPLVQKQTQAIAVAAAVKRKKKARRRLNAKTVHTYAADYHTANKCILMGTKPGNRPSDAYFENRRRKKNESI